MKRKHDKKFFQFNWAFSHKFNHLKLTANIFPDGKFMRSELHHVCQGLHLDVKIGFLGVQFVQLLVHKVLIQRKD